MCVWGCVCVCVHRWGSRKTCPHSSYGNVQVSSLCNFKKWSSEEMGDYCWLVKLSSESFAFFLKGAGVYQSASQVSVLFSARGRGLWDGKLSSGHDPWPIWVICDFLVCLLRWIVVDSCWSSSSWVGIQGFLEGGSYWVNLRTGQLSAGPVSWKSPGETSEGCFLFVR